MAPLEVLLMLVLPIAHRLPAKFVRKQGAGAAHKPPIASKAS